MLFPLEEKEEEDLELQPYEVQFTERFGLELEPASRVLQTGAIVVGYFSKFSERKVKL